MADVRVLRSLAVSGDRLAQGLAIQPLARFAGRAFDPALVALAQSDDIEGSYKHILTDLAAFIFTAIAAVVILTTGFRRADGIAALIVAGIMLWAAYGLLRDSGRVFLEAAPERMDVQEIGRAISKFPNVASYHDLHVWEIGSDFPSLSAHVPVAVGEDCHAIRRGLEQVIEQRFEIDHTTLQWITSAAGSFSRLARQRRWRTPNTERPSSVKSRDARSVIDEGAGVARTRQTQRDGARLWQCGPFYGRSLAEIGALFDTVYVSFSRTLVRRQAARWRGRRT